MADAPLSSRPGERPRSVTLVAWGVIILGIVNGWRSIVLFQQRQLLLNLDAILDPALVAVASAIWSLISIIIAIGIFRRKAAVRWISPIILFIYTLYIFLRDWFLADLTNNSNPGLENISLLAIVFFSVSVLMISFILNRKASRDYFALK